MGKHFGRTGHVEAKYLKAEEKNVRGFCLHLPSPPPPLDLIGLDDEVMQTDEKKRPETVSTEVLDRKKSKTSLNTADTNDRSEQTATVVSPGCGESALPDDKKEGALENLEDDWQNDPDNARNWPNSKRWLTISVVCSSDSTGFYVVKWLISPC